MKKEKWLFALAVGAGVAAVTYSLLSKDIPDGAAPVQPFDKNRYLGTWHEIARMPSLLEKNIKNLTEEYSLSNDGLIKVVTRGFNDKKGKWIKLSGKVKFAGRGDIGKLKVSYFGPVYASYNILDIDDSYSYALISGSGIGFLWILSRETTIPEAIKLRFLKRALDIGFDTSKLEWDIA